jgi:hypothetical protein
MHQLHIHVILTIPMQHKTCNNLFPGHKKATKITSKHESLHDAHYMPMLQGSFESVKSKIVQNATLTHSHIHLLAQRITSTISKKPKKKLALIVSQQNTGTNFQ